MRNVICVFLSALLALLAVSALAADDEIGSCVFRVADWRARHYDAGFYEVGVDIPAGRYVLHAADDLNVYMQVGSQAYRDDVDMHSPDYVSYIVATPGSRMYSASLVDVHTPIDLHDGQFVESWNDFLLLPPDAIHYMFDVPWQSDFNYTRFNYDTALNSPDEYVGASGVIGGCVAFTDASPDLPGYQICVAATGADSGNAADYIAFAISEEYAPRTLRAGDAVEFFVVMLGAVDIPLTDGTTLTVPMCVAYDTRIIE